MRVVGAAVLMLWSVVAGAQVDYRTTEAGTLGYFNQKNWKALAALGDSALAEGLDYYALRYRMGVAFYEKKDYWRSARHFGQALHFNSADPLSQEYLYYALLFSGRDDEAFFVSKKFGEALREKLQIRPVKAVDWMYAEAGRKLSTAPDSVGDMTFASFWLGHRLGYRWRLTQALVWLQLPVKTQVINQYEYYLRSRYSFSRSFRGMAAIHYAFAKATPQPEQRLEEADWAVQLGAEKRWGRVAVAPYFAHIATRVTQFPEEPAVYTVATWQGGISTSIVPAFGRSPLFIKGMAAWHHSQGTGRLIWSAEARWQLTPKLAAEMGYSKSGAGYFLENDASLFNNAISLTEERFSLLLSRTLSGRWMLFAGGQREKKRDSYTDFFYNTFLLGIKSQL